MEKDIFDPIDILHKYFSIERLRELDRANGFDGSETDTIKMHLYHAELLRNLAFKCKDKAEQRKLLDAAVYFETLHDREFRNK